MKGKILVRASKAIPGCCFPQVKNTRFRGPAEPFGQDCQFQETLFAELYLIGARAKGLCRILVFSPLMVRAPSWIRVLAKPHAFGQVRGREEKTRACLFCPQCIQIQARHRESIVGEDGIEALLRPFGPHPCRGKGQRFRLPGLLSRFWVKRARSDILAQLRDFIQVFAESSS